MKGQVSQRNRAVVIGASIAGLSAATVLSHRFEQVVLIERDTLGEMPGERKGVPQGRHSHALLPAGHIRIEQWFRGITEALVADGALDLDVGEDFLLFAGERPRLRFRSGIRAPFSSRVLLEHHIRQRVLALPNVSLRSGSGAAGLTTCDDARTITGVALDDGTTVEADLVVDASGRAARSVPWLSALGYDEPPTSVVTINMGYASRVFRKNPDEHRSWEACYVMTPPPSGREGVVFPLEGDRWMVTLAGFHGDQPPRDPGGFAAFARSLPCPMVAEVIESSEPLTDIVIHRMPSNQRRHVERLRSVPRGLVMLGDAVCSFNPIYAQGMSTSILQAEALGEALDATSTLDERFVRSFYRRAGKVVTPAWQMTTGADFALPQTTGRKAPGTDMVNRYMARAMRASEVNEGVCRRMIEVMSLLRPPRDMMTPAMMALVGRVNRAMDAAAPSRISGQSQLDAVELAEAA